MGADIAGFEIDAFAGGDTNEGRGREHLAGSAIPDVDVTIPLRRQEHFAHVTFDLEIEDQVLIYPVVIELVVRVHLVIPVRLTGIGIARENAARPFVIAGSQLRIPNARIPRRGLLGKLRARLAE